MKMLVVDDHAILRQGLAALLTGAGAASEVLHAASQADGLALAAAHPDLDAVFLDLRLPDGDGVAAIGAFAELNPALPIIIVSASEDPADVRRAIDHGALGYVPKSASPETMLSAVRLVMSGGVYVPPLMLTAQQARDGAPLSTPEPLTPRQTEVLGALARGMSNKQIGLHFGLSEKTVKVHVGAICRALGVTNRPLAARAAHAAGIIPPPGS
jgi:two-component system nitrate/nitrite response regulator NarL